MAELVISYEPQPRQAVFHQAEADEILYGGAAGGGKSEGTIFDALLYAMTYPASKQIIFRRTFPDLKRSIILRTLQVYPPELGKFNSADKVWRFINGSTIELAYWDNDSNFMNYQGAEYDVIRWEELTQFHESWYKYMLSRLRGSTPYPRSVRSTTNPGGLGHSWVKKRFVSIGEPETAHDMPELDDDGNTLVWPEGIPGKTAGEPIVRSRMFIPATLFDNQALLKEDPSYLARLMSLPDTERKQLLEGDWDVFAGQYFSEFERPVHVVDDFPIPMDWQRYRSFDEGYNDPFVCTWFALSPDGTAYLYRELAQSKLLTSDQIHHTHLNSPVTERYRYNVADTSFWNKSKTEDVTPAEMFALKSIPLTQAKKERVNGWKRVREWLHPYEKMDHVTGKTYRTANFKIFKSCIKAIEALPALMHDDRMVEDVAPHKLDHIPDTIRYFFMSDPRQVGNESAWVASPTAKTKRDERYDEDDEDDEPQQKSYWSR